MQHLKLVSNNQRISFENARSYFLEEEEKKSEDDFNLLKAAPLMTIHDNMPTETHDIFRPRAFHEIDIYSEERRIFPSTPIVFTMSADKVSLNLDDRLNCENCISRVDALNSISMDVSTSSFLCPLFEEYRVPTVEELGLREYHLIRSSKFIAFTESALCSTAR